MRWAEDEGEVQQRRGWWRRKKKERKKEGGEKRTLGGSMGIWKVEVRRGRMGGRPGEASANQHPPSFSSRVSGVLVSGPQHSGTSGGPPQFCTGKGVRRISLNFPSSSLLLFTFSPFHLALFLLGPKFSCLIFLGGECRPSHPIPFLFCFLFSLSLFSFLSDTIPPCTMLCMQWSCSCNPIWSGIF